MCAANILGSQLLQALLLAGTLIGLGLVAFALDRFALKLAEWGALETTVLEVRRTAAWLLRFDLTLVIVVAAGHSFQAGRCLLGL